MVTWEGTVTDVVAYGSTTGEKGSVSLFDDGLEMQGNLWRKVGFDYTITENTVLEFQFRSTVQGEIHGIGFETDDNYKTGPVNIQLYGTQDDASSGRYFDRDSYHYEGQGEWQTFRIQASDYIMGDIKYLTFINDHDVKNPDGQSMFRHITLYEDIPPLPQPPDITIDMDNFSSYSSQDVTSHIEAAYANGIEIFGNTWQKMAFAYEITENTILEFQFKSEIQGEIHGIGFETDNSYKTGPVTIQLYGSQQDSASGVYFDRDSYHYEGEGEWQHFRIHAADYASGQINFLTFISDHDVKHPDAQSAFQNIRLYEVGEAFPADLPVNHVPSALDDYAVITRTQTSVTLDVLHNDSDKDGESLIIHHVEQPLHGSIIYNTDGNIVYTPHDGYYGGDAFTYAVTDGISIDTATIAINAHVIHVDDFGAIGDGTYHAVSEWLIGGQFDRGYKNLTEIQRDYSFVVSLDKSIDSVAVQAAFNAMPNYGEIFFTSGKTYVFNDLVKVCDKSFDAYMEGATIKMADNSIYNAIVISDSDNNTADYNEYVNWHGGTFDGNKDNIDWMGSNHADTQFKTIEEGGTEEFNQKLHWSREISSAGLLGIKNTKYVVVENVSIVNNIDDGVVLSRVLDGTIKNSTGSGGAKMNWQEFKEIYGGGMQNSYFKATQRPDSDSDFDGGVFTLDNVHTTGGSIAFQLYTTLDERETPPNAKIVISNSSAHNAYQGGVIVEHAPYVDIYNSRFTQDDNSYQTDLWIGNGTKYALLDNVTMIGDGIDFNESISLVEAVITNSTVIDHETGSNVYGKTEYAIKGATHVINSYIETDHGVGVHARYLENTQIMKFGTEAVTGASELYNVTIDNALNGGDGLALNDARDRTVIDGSTISNVRKVADIKTGDVYIKDSVFTNIGHDAVSISSNNTVGTVVLNNVAVAEYGLLAENDGDRAVIGGGMDPQVQQIAISQDSHFSSNAGYGVIADRGNLWDNIEYFDNTSNEPTVHTGSDAADSLTGSYTRDILQGSESGDTLTGGFGGDTFIFARNDTDVADTITDFYRAEGDKIDISALMANYDPTIHAVSQFIKLTQLENGTMLAIDNTGSGECFKDVAYIHNVSSSSGMTLDEFLEVAVL